jgi:hypothetical protein
VWRLLGWLLWGFEALAIAVLVVLAPIAAIYGFASGDTKMGWTALALFAGGLVFAALHVFDAIEHPWARREKD